MRRTILRVGTVFGFDLNKLAPGILCLAVFLPEEAFATKALWYGRAEGLPSSQVHAVAQTPDGYLWFATPAGLARFDGASARVSGKAAGLSTQGLRTVAVAPDGVLWVGHDVGVDRVLASGEIRSAPGAFDGFVESFAFGPNGDVWIASSSGLVRWSEGSGFRPVAEATIGQRLVIGVAMWGDEVLAATSEALFAERPNGVFERVSDPALDQLGALVAISSAQGQIWIGGERGAAWRGPSGWSVFPLVASDPEVSAILQTGDELWVGAGREIQRYHWRGDTWSLGEVVADSVVVNEFFEDEYANVWAATDSRGAARIPALRTLLGPARIPCEGQVYSISETPDGLLVGSDTCSWTTDLDLVPKGRLEGLDGVEVWDLQQFRDGAVWAATETGLQRAPNLQSPFRLTDFGLEVLRAPGRCLLEHGDVRWIGTVLGLARHDGESVVEVLGPDERRLGYVYTLEHDGQGGLWIGTIGRGLWRVRAGERVARPVAALSSGNVYSLAVQNDQLVVSRDDEVLVRSGDGFEPISLGQDDGVAAWALEFEDEHTLWIGSNSGLLSYDFASETRRRFVTSMGLAGDEFTTSRSLRFVPRSGRLVQGTVGGLSWLNPDRLQEFDTSPVLELDQTVLDGTPTVPGDDGLEVLQGRWTLDLEVTAPWFLDPENLTYRYRLDGYESGWSDPRLLRERRVRFSSLAPGTYRLIGQVHSPLVGWGPPSTLIELRVVPRWYNTWPARIAALLLFALFLIAAWRGRTRQLRARARELEQLVADRTRELEKLAARDPLTGLLNRRALLDATERILSEAARRKESAALVLIDLDGFKAVNDRFGHQTGDHALQEVARRLQDEVRREDVLARFGGDEFVLVCKLKSKDEAMAAVRRLRVAVQAPLALRADDQVIRLAASIGVALWRQGESFDELFRRADLAVYRAKEQGDSIELWSGDFEFAGPE